MHRHPLFAVPCVLLGITIYLYVSLRSTNHRLEVIIDDQHETQQVTARRADQLDRRLETCERDRADARTNAQGSLQAYVEAAQQLEFCKLGRQVR